SARPQPETPRLQTPKTCGVGRAFDSAHLACRPARLCRSAPAGSVLCNATPYGVGAGWALCTHSGIGKRRTRQMKEAAGGAVSFPYRLITSLVPRIRAWAAVWGAALV